jgi:hypothetical protein
MTDRDAILALEDAELLAQCRVDTYKASGPGGQHRNKVSSAVRLRHEPSGVSAHGDESRSQHDNKRVALRRLRMHLALELRKPPPTARQPLPEVVRSCLHKPKGREAAAALRLDVGRRDGRFWPVAAFVLDLLAGREGRLSEAAAEMGISTSNLVSMLKSERHLLAAAQRMRREYGLKPIS